MKLKIRHVILLLVALLELIVLLVFQIRQVNVQADLLSPAEGEETGIYGPLRLQFHQPMDQASVEAHFSLTPTAPGRFEWEEETLLFFPEIPLAPKQTYTLTLSAGAESENGREVNDALSWTFTVRSPDILYLSLAESGGDLWVWDTTEQAAHQLTETRGSVIDFDPSRTGEAVVYAALNSDGGSDLWTVDRNGEAKSMTLDCGPDYCTQPVWSPDDDWVAYTRETYDAATGSHQGSRIWALNMETGDSNPLYQSEDAAGHSPSFSPDGERLASFDLTQNGIRILDLATSQESIIPTSLQDLGDWSADGNRYLFTNLIPSVLESESTLYIADLETQSIQEALGGDVEGTTFSQPRWAPDGEWVAVALRPTNSAANRSLWVLRIDGSEAISVENDGTADASSYRWGPWGKQLVYQTYRSGDPTSPSAIWLWDWDSRESILLTGGAARPIWLP